MKHYTIKKLFKGYASVRSIIVNKCIKNNEKLRLKYKDEEKILSVDDLKKGVQFHKKTFQSKFNPNETYELIDFLWGV